MSREINRAYRILGLPPGASSDEVKRSYRDLAQVWHPDRFGHSERLQQKAQRNLTRINEAYQTLKDYQPPANLDPESIFSTTMSAVLDMGDIMQSRVINRQRVRVASRPAPARPTGQPTARRRRSKVMGLEEWERTGVLKQHTPRRRRLWLWVAAAVLIVVAAMVALAPAARRFLVGP